jgi:cell division protein ZapA (FtsZ GTPase activity inhibitor)
LKPSRQAASAWFRGGFAWPSAARKLPRIFHCQGSGKVRGKLMTVAKLYALNVEADVESLSTHLAELREKARKTLVEAQNEFEQISASPVGPNSKRNRKAARQSLEMWAEIDERIEDAFEDLDKAIREIRKPFRK